MVRFAPKAVMGTPGKFTMNFVEPAMGHRTFNLVAVQAAQVESVYSRWLMGELCPSAFHSSANQEDLSRNQFFSRHRFVFIFQLS